MHRVMISRNSGYLGEREDALAMKNGWTKESWIQRVQWVWAVAFVPITGPIVIPGPFEVRLGLGNCTNGPVYFANLSNTPQKRSQGLSGVKKMGAREAMLFEWPTDTQDEFWMKETYVDLTLVFFDHTGKWVWAYDMPTEKNKADPKERYPSPQPYRFAIEVAGFRAKKFGPKTLLCVKKPVRFKSRDSKVL